MPAIDRTSAEIGMMDRLSSRDTPIHRLDPRAKLVVTLVFVVIVVSFGKYEIAGLLPFVLFPVVMAVLADLPAAFLLRRILLVSPFALLLGMFNPMIDRQPLLAVAGVVLSGGWVSFISILIRFVLTVSAALILLASTGIYRVCQALEKLGVPSIFTIQLLFLYRYLFVLVEEGGRMALARSLRSFEGRGRGMKVYGHMLGALLVRTLDRAQRIHLAMTCRGFDGHVRTLDEPQMARRDVIFVLGWSLLFVVMRWINLPQWAGAVVMEIFQ